jgi:hypothetical protein
MGGSSLLSRKFAQAREPDQMLVARVADDKKLRGVAPSTVRLTVTETLVQEVAKSASGVHLRQLV